MADSARKKVIDAFVSAIDGSTGVISASQKQKNWANLLPHEFPYVWVHDQETAIEQLAFASTSLPDKEADMSLAATGYVFDKHNVTGAKRTNLISDIEKSVARSTALAALVISVDPVRVVTDDQTLDNYSIATVEFRAIYHYNHLSP